MAGAVEAALLDIIAHHQARVVRQVVVALCPHAVLARMIERSTGEASLLAHARTGLAIRRVKDM
jgi:hypothetical protein